MSKVLATIGLACILSVSSGGVVRAEKPEVVIGVLNDQAGANADITGRGSVVAAQMAVDDFGGKVLGKPVRIVSADHQNKPDIGAGIAREWFEKDVDAIADVPTSSVALAVQEVARQKKRIFLITGASSSDLFGKFCSPYGFMWAFDTYALAEGTATEVVRQGGDTWFFLTADYAFGHALERDATTFVRKGGGRVLGSISHPQYDPDLSSYLLQAQASRAKIVALANVGTDTITAIKEAVDFGLVAGGQRLVGLLVFVTDVNAIGLPVAQGLQLTTSFYWDMDEQTRAWSKRFMVLYRGRAPTLVHAGTYGAVLHYLKAVQAAGTLDADAVAAKMRELPVNDFYTKDARIRADNRVMRDFYLMEVKRPEESRYPWDFYKLVRRIPAAEAARPLAEGGCPLATSAAE